MCKGASPPSAPTGAAERATCPGSTLPSLGLRASRFQKLSLAVEQVLEEFVPNRKGYPLLDLARAPSHGSSLTRPGEGERRRIHRPEESWEHALDAALGEHKAAGAKRKRDLHKAALSLVCEMEFGKSREDRLRMGGHSTSMSKRCKVAAKVLLDEMEAVSRVKEPCAQWTGIHMDLPRLLTRPCVPCAPSCASLSTGLTGATVSQEEAPATLFVHEAEAAPGQETEASAATHPATRSDTESLDSRDEPSSSAGSCPREQEAEAVGRSGASSTSTTVDYARICFRSRNLPLAQLQKGKKWPVVFGVQLVPDLRLN